MLVAKSLSYLRDYYYSNYLNYYNCYMIFKSEGPPINASPQPDVQ